MNLSKDKHIFIPLFLAFAAIVGFRAWRDMHEPPPPPSARFDAFYLVKSNAELVPFTSNPDDERVLIVWAGDIKTDKGGGLSLKHTPVAPVSLPQREIIPLYTLDAAPQSTEALAKLLMSTTKSWVEKGDIINDIYIEGPDDGADFARLVDDSRELRHDLQEKYWLGLLASRKSIENLPDRVRRLEDAGESVRTLIISGAGGIKPGEKIEDYIRDLDKKAVLPFIVEVDSHPDFDKLEKTLQPQPELFTGFVLPASAADNNNLR